MTAAVDVSNWATTSSGADAVASMASGLRGSQILIIAQEVRALEAQGTPVANLTVGDFAPAQFPLPGGLGGLIAEALAAGETNYPPADGMPALRRAVADLYRRELGLDYPQASIVIGGGARPILYGTFRAVVDPGDVVVYPAPGWNTEHYVHLSGAVGVRLDCGPEAGFLPTIEQIAPHLERARLICLCSPSNPAGTVYSREQLAPIVAAMVVENEQRARAGARPVFLMFDQVYWTLTAPGQRHCTPVELDPRAAAWTIFVDAASKSLAATGLRVGWGVGPTGVMARMRDVLGHAGAWAPRAEQVAVARLLADPERTARAFAEVRDPINARLSRLAEGLMSLGPLVRVLPPAGAIYLSVQVDLVGKGRFQTDDDLRRSLLTEAGIAVVPLGAFGWPVQAGWFRLSVGAIGLDDIPAIVERWRAWLDRQAI